MSKRVEMDVFHKLIRAALSCVVVVSAVVCQTSLHAQAVSVKILHSDQEFQSMVSDYFAATRASHGPCEWSALLQRQSSERLDVVIVIKTANAKMFVSYGSCKFNGNKIITADQGHAGNQNALSSAMHPIIIDATNKVGLLAVIQDLMKISINPFSPVSEYLDADNYHVEVVHPPTSLIIRLNSIDSKQSSIASLVDGIIAVLDKKS